MQEKKAHGFTLIELLLVISIMLTVGSFSVVFFSRFLTQNAVANTQDRLLGQLRKAQMYAMMGKQNGNWGVRFGSNTITLFLQGNSAFDEKFTENATISISGFSEIVFTKTTGLPSTTGTYTIAGNDSSRQVTVNSQGVVSR
ncbi:MAG: prepilin-type N-terminal cleavage/methylation domain-containing protein [Patescibacteria group bacterium]